MHKTHSTANNMTVGKTPLSARRSERKLLWIISRITEIVPLNSRIIVLQTDRTAKTALPTDRMISRRTRKIRMLRTSPGRTVRTDDLFCGILWNATEKSAAFSVLPSDPWYYPRYWSDNDERIICNRRSAQLYCMYGKRKGTVVKNGQDLMQIPSGTCFMHAFRSKRQLCSIHRGGRRAFGAYFFLTWWCQACVQNSLYTWASSICSEWILRSSDGGKNHICLNPLVN